MKKEFDHLILGAGIYGLYAAKVLADNYPDKTIAVLEYDSAPFMRASYVNQARVHNGYHYPRSLWTALKSAGYYARFNEDFDFAFNTSFTKIYATSEELSYSTAENFKEFCKAAGIQCEEIHPGKYFKPGKVSGAFISDEYAFDAYKIRDYFMEYLQGKKNVEIFFDFRLNETDTRGDCYVLGDGEGNTFQAPFVLSAVYASINQILDKFGFDPTAIKYEIAEICLCDVTDNIKDAGLTVMDGPFFSVMPFGLDGTFSLSAVHFTPHKTSYDALPEFACQSGNPDCTPAQLENCNICPTKPATEWDKMYQLAKKYLNDDIDMYFKESIVAIKPILKASEVNDSRPTIIKKYSDNPTFISVLSGKINTIYDLDEVLL